jgi:hypothetical protein
MVNFDPGNLSSLITDPVKSGPDPLHTAFKRQTQGHVVASERPTSVPALRPLAALSKRYKRLLEPSMPCTLNNSNAL